MQRTAVKLKDALLIIGGIVAVDVVILALWTGIDPLKASHCVETFAEMCM